MKSSNLLFSLCETIGGGNKYITINDESSESEMGTIAELMDNVSFEFTTGKLLKNRCYLLSDVPLHDAKPSFIFSNKLNGGKTSYFGYLMDDEPTKFVI